MTSLFAGNLLDPLTFGEGEIGIFIRDNRCAFCGSKFLSRHTVNRRWEAICPEHGVVHEYQYVPRHTAEVVENNERAGTSELRQPSGKTPEKLIKELGY